MPGSKLLMIRQLCNESRKGIYGKVVVETNWRIGNFGVFAVFCRHISYFYIFEQDWFYTILYNDYTGFAYIGYLAVVFAFLCDVVFNRARVTTEIINSILSAVGQAPSLVPC